jgi:hypothetical protein
MAQVSLIGSAVDWTVCGQCGMHLRWLFAEMQLRLGGRVSCGAALGMAGMLSKRTAA